MDIQYEPTKIKIHWNYLVALEHDFQALSRYIEPCKANKDVFSIELARIIMASTQETDVVMKSLCKLLDVSVQPKKINQYFPIVSEHVPELISEKVSIPRFSMATKPWSSWKEDTPPIWWTANNKIKHQRSDEYHRATLENAFNSLAALLIVTSYFYKKEMEIEKNVSNIDWMEVTHGLIPKMNLFRLNDTYYYGDVVMGASEW